MPASPRPAAAPLPLPRRAPAEPDAMKTFVAVLLMACVAGAAAQRINKKEVAAPEFESVVEFLVENNFTTLAGFATVSARRGRCRRGWRVAGWRSQIACGDHMIMAACLVRAAACPPLQTLRRTGSLLPRS